MKHYLVKHFKESKEAEKWLNDNLNDGYVLHSMSTCVDETELYLTVIMGRKS